MCAKSKSRLLIIVRNTVKKACCFFQLFAPDYSTFFLNCKPIGQAYMSDFIF